ncbi:MAG: PilZ domain-containing protein [Phycisphaerae bacterium]|nr:PilZ domain-containing protein [Phycisphaerae bacterium]
MKPRRVLTPQDTAVIFERAVQERALAVLTLQDGQHWATFKSRFLERDQNGKFFVLDYEPVEGNVLPALTTGQFVGVSFRQKSRKILFATVVEAKGHFACDDKTSITAIRYRWPESITELQRRAYYRTPIPPEMTLFAAVWPGGVTAHQQAQSAQQLATGKLVNVSCGGALIDLQKAVPINWNENDQIGIEMQLPDGRPPVLLDARQRGTRQTETGTVGLAIQFIGLEMQPDSRSVLRRLANCVQRLHRLSISSGRRDWNSKNKL